MSNKNRIAYQFMSKISSLFQKLTDDLLKKYIDQLKRFKETSEKGAALSLSIVNIKS